jgi:hypothetical protein
MRNLQSGGSERRTRQLEVSMKFFDRTNDLFFALAGKLPIVQLIASNI